MLIPVPPSECMRAREAASGRLDGELSEIEAVRLDTHLRRCATCREFARQAAAFTVELRAAPLERPAMSTFEPRRKHERALRMPGTVAAAMVVLGVASVALGRVHLGAQGPPRRAVPIRSISGSAAMIQRDALEQRLLAMLPATERWRTELPDGQMPAL